MKFKKKSCPSETLCLNMFDTYDLNINYNKEIIVKYNILNIKLT